MPPNGPIVTQLTLRRTANVDATSDGLKHALESDSGLAGRSSLGEAFVRAAMRYAARPVLILANGTSISFARLLQAACEVRDHLLRGPRLQPGDRTILLLKNSPEYLAAFYGTLLAGGVVVPLPPEIERGRLEQIIDASEAVVILTGPAELRRRGGLSNAPVRVLELCHSAGSVGLSLHCAEGRGSDLAALFFTSGSTGEPKGVMLSHDNFLANARSICQSVEIGLEDRALGLLPFYHAFGNSVLQTHVLSGAALVLDGALTFPQTILDAIRDHRVTSLSGVPDVFRVLLSRTSLGEVDLPTLRYAAVAGGRLEPDHVLAVAARIAPARFFVMYGQTEATARLAVLPPEKLEKHYGSCGRAIPGVELQVVDEQGHPVRPGEVGEIRARGPNVMLGYWRDPELTAQTLRDAWLLTGDLATIDAEGFLYPQGRRSALVKIGGHRVHPREIEDFMARHLTAQQIVVVPFEASELGTRLALFVQPWARNGSLSVEEIRRLCVRELPRHKVPEHIEILTRLPLTDALKIDRPALQRRATEASGKLSIPTEPDRNPKTPSKDH